MLLLLHMIVTYIKENMITKYKNYTAHPETLGQVINCPCYLWKNLFAWMIYRSCAQNIERPGTPALTGYSCENFQFGMT